MQSGVELILTLLLKAWKNRKADFPDWHVTIMGNGDVDALAMQLRKLMKSPDLRREMAEYSKIFGERVFAPVRVNESIEKLYKEIFKV